MIPSDSLVATVNEGRKKTGLTHIPQFSFFISLSIVGDKGKIQTMATFFFSLFKIWIDRFHSQKLIVGPLKGEKINVFVGNSFLYTMHFVCDYHRVGFLCHSNLIP